MFATHLHGLHAQNTTSSSSNTAVYTACETAPVIPYASINLLCQLFHLLRQPDGRAVAAVQVCLPLALCFGEVTTLRNWASCLPSN